MCHPSNHSCQYPWLSPACGTYSSKLTFQLLYSAWLLRSWRKRQNGPCYQHGKFMITNPLPGLQCRLGGCLCFQSMALFSGFMTNSTLPSVPSLLHSLQAILWEKKFTIIKAIKKKSMNLVFSPVNYLQGHVSLSPSFLWRWDRCSLLSLTQNSHKPRYSYLICMSLRACVL